MRSFPRSKLWKGRNRSQKRISFLVSFLGKANYKELRVRRPSFSIETTALTRDINPDSRLIEIAQVVKYSHQHPSEEGAAEGAVSEPGAGAGITAHAHPGSLLFVQESELDNEIDVPVVGDNEFDVPIIGGVPPPEEPTVYEVEPEAEHKPVEVVEPVSGFISLIRQLH